MLTESKEIDKIEIVNNAIQVRERIVVKRDDVPIASSFHRVAYSVTDDMSNADPKVIAIAKVIWPEKFAETPAE